VTLTVDLWPLDLTFAPLVTLTLRKFLIYGYCEKIGGTGPTDRRTDGRSATLNAAFREGRIIRSAKVTKVGRGLQSRCGSAADESEYVVWNASRLDVERVVIVSGWRASVTAVIWRLAVDLLLLHSPVLKPCFHLQRTQFQFTAGLLRLYWHRDRIFWPWPLMASVLALFLLRSAWNNRPYFARTFSCHLSSSYYF